MFHVQRRGGKWSVKFSNCQILFWDNCLSIEFQKILFLLEIVRLHHEFFVRSSYVQRISEKILTKVAIWKAQFVREKTINRTASSINYPNNNKRRNLRAFEDWQPLILVLKFCSSSIDERTPVGIQSDGDTNLLQTRDYNLRLCIMATIDLSQTKETKEL